MGYLDLSFLMPLVCVSFIGFHASIHFLQGLDFSTWWCPCLLVMIDNGYEGVPLTSIEQTVLVAAFVAVCSLIDMWHEVLPLSCIPMFGLPWHEGAPSRFFFQSANPRFYPVTMQVPIGP